MDWGQIQSSWGQAVTSARQRWDKFSTEELQELRGDRDALIRKLKEKYGMSHQQAEKEVDDFHQQQAGSQAPGGQTRTSGGGH